MVEHQHALAAGDVDAIVAAFEADGYAREPEGAKHVGRDGLRAFYARMFASGGGIAQERCAIVGDEDACALEYNVARWGSAPRLPQAGVAVYVRGQRGKLAAVRVYDDVEPPHGAAVCASTLTIVPPGSSTKNRRTPHGSSLSA